MIYSLISDLINDLQVQLQIVPKNLEANVDGEIPWKDEEPIIVNEQTKEQDKNWKSCTRPGVPVDVKLKVNTAHSNTRYVCTQIMLKWADSSYNTPWSDLKWKGPILADRSIFPSINGDGALLYDPEHIGPVTGDIRLYQDTVTELQWYTQPELGRTRWYMIGITLYCNNIGNTYWSSVRIDNGAAIPEFSVTPTTDPNKEVPHEKTYWIYQLDKKSEKTRRFNIEIPENTGLQPTIGIKTVTLATSTESATINLPTKPGEILPLEQRIIPVTVHFSESGQSGLTTQNGGFVYTIGKNLWNEQTWPFTTSIANKWNYDVINTGFVLRQHFIPVISGSELEFETGTQTSKDQTNTSSYNVSVSIPGSKFSNFSQLDPAESFGYTLYYTDKSTQEQVKKVGNEVVWLADAFMGSFDLETIPDRIELTQIKVTGAPIHSSQALLDDKDEVTYQLQNLYFFLPYSMNNFKNIETGALQIQGLVERVQGEKKELFLGRREENIYCTFTGLLQENNKRFIRIEIMKDNAPTNIITQAFYGNKVSIPITNREKVQVRLRVFLQSSKSKEPIFLHIPITFTTFWYSSFEVGNLATVDTPVEIFNSMSTESTLILPIKGPLSLDASGVEASFGVVLSTGSPLELRNKTLTNSPIGTITGYTPDPSSITATFNNKNFPDEQESINKQHEWEIYALDCWKMQGILQIKSGQVTCVETKVETMVQTNYIKIGEALITCNYYSALTPSTEPAPSLSIETGGKYVTLTNPECPLLPGMKSQIKVVCTKESKVPYQYTLKYKKDTIIYDLPATIIETRKEDGTVTIQADFSFVTSNDEAGFNLILEENYKHSKIYQVTLSYKDVQKETNQMTGISWGEMTTTTTTADTPNGFNIEYKETSPKKPGNAEVKYALVDESTRNTDEKITLIENGGQLFGEVSKRPEWNSHNYQIETTTSYTVYLTTNKKDPYKWSETSLSNFMTCYMAMPTVSYRPYQVGLNTKLLSDNTGNILTIEPHSDIKNIGLLNNTATIKLLAEAGKPNQVIMTGFIINDNKITGGTVSNATIEGGSINSIIIDGGTWDKI